MINNNFYSKYFKEFNNHTQNLDLTKIKDRKINNRNIKKK